MKHKSGLICSKVLSVFLNISVRPLQSFLSYLYGYVPVGKNGSAAATSIMLFKTKKMLKSHVVGVGKVARVPFLFHGTHKLQPYQPDNLDPKKFLFIS